MDRRARVRVLGIALLLVMAALVVQAATADQAPSGVVRANTDIYPGHTLITVQSYQSFSTNNGKALVVAPNGSVIWEYDPEDSRVFDGELLENGNMLLSLATAVPAEACPPAYRDTEKFPDHCVRNRVVELDYETKQVVWNYSWYDAFIHWHEVHDADRLPSGETAIIDMGNDRAFTVNREGSITWSWNGTERLGPGSEFWAEQIPERTRDRYRPASPESDWTHMNDIDRLANGHFQLSIRNFDVVIEVDPETNRILDVVGRPGAHSIMREQHDPARLADGTVIIADSGNNRAVEVTHADDSRVWVYTGDEDHLQWPRDADRLPNGNTLLVDSRNLRVLEVNPAGDVVWEYSLRESVGIVYDADRLSVPEEPRAVPTGRDLAQLDSTNPLTGFVSYVESWAGLVFPSWVRFPELVTITLGVVLGLAMGIEVARHAYETHRLR